MADLWWTVFMVVSVFLWAFVLVRNYKEVNAFLKRHLTPEPTESDEEKQ